jgi:hypothetical protein
MGTIKNAVYAAFMRALGAEPVEPVEPDTPLPRVISTEEAKSLRDGAVAGEVIPGTGIGVITHTGGLDTRRLFKKRGVNLLRAYAENSVWVRAAIDINRAYVGQSEWKLTPHDRTRGMDDRVVREISERLNNPNLLGEPYCETKEKFAEDLLVIGHGVIEQVLRRDLIPLELRAMDAARLAFVNGWDGSRPDLPRFAELDPGMMRPVRYLADPMVMCLINRPRSYDYLGLSHVEILDMSIRALLEADDYHLRQISEPAPNGALNLGEGVSQKQVDDVRAQIQSVKRAFIVMGGTKGTDFIRFDATTQQLKLLDTQVWFVRQVAAIFRVSTAALRLAVDTSRANTEAMFSEDQEGPSALLRRIRDLENARIVRRWGPVEEHNVRLDYPIIGHRDEKEQADIAAIQFAGMPFASMNEVRLATGLEEWDTTKYMFADEPLIMVGGEPIPMSIWQERVRQEPKDTPTQDNKNPQPANDNQQQDEGQKSLGSGVPPRLLKGATQDEPVHWSQDALNAMTGHADADLKETLAWLKRIGQSETGAIFNAGVSE